ncbi:hypothetical protein [Anaeroselena agilis]|uniref:Uncharacterized protein n=1 Tax=Anaeroselena agilis TaxID=3063788 RepID=A0ABU3NV89_9FIRM|nr:hypothetical protein [Selenomonadales bacterium 4137-cl]
MKRLLVVAAFVAALVLAGGTALAWHAPAEGVPAALRQGAERGYFIWHDGDGLHLRVHARVSTRPFSGSIRTDGHFAAVHGRKLEYGDHYRLDNDKKTIRFQFRTAGAMDGLDFRVAGGSYVAFTLMVDGAQANPDGIFIGHEGWRPSSHRFTLRR